MAAYRHGRVRAGVVKAAVVVAAAAGVVACSAIGSQTNAYATLAEARQAGAIDRGWIPEGLPSGAHDLREVHVPGTAERWGLFEFPPDQGDSLRALVDSAELPLGSLECRPPKRIEWWPPALRGRLDPEKLGVTGLRAYRARSADLVYAVNWKQGRAYYWAVPRE